MANGTQTPTHGLGELILDQGIQNTYFFNGRLLTATDLQAEQLANRQHGQLIGQVTGEGVGTGLEVAVVSPGSGSSPPVLSVTAGVALNRSGQTLTLPLDVQVTLGSQTIAPTVEANLFSACTRGPGGPLDVGQGAYLLVISPGSGYQQQVPRRGLGANASVIDCGYRYVVEGVKFRLEPIEIGKLTGLSQATRDTLGHLMTLNDPASISKVRSWLAHICFGTEELASFGQDPFRRTSSSKSPFLSYGAIDALHDAGNLCDCDVPLALVYWPSSGFQFADTWSARRRPAVRSRSSAWPLPVSDRRLAEAEAAFQQFQDHAAWLMGSTASASTLASLHVGDYFRYLPSAGFLPLAGGSFRGFTVDAFFSEQPHRDPEFVDAAIVRSIFDQALRFEPIDLTAGELAWVYQPWQNSQTIADGATIQPYVVFTTGHMPHRAVARFDLARWDESNYVGGIGVT